MTRVPSVAAIDNPTSAAAAVRAFRAYPKVLSWLVLHAGRLPALPGIVITEWTAEAATSVAQFAERWKSRSLLIRSDSLAESGLSPRGGLLVEKRHAERETRALLNQGRIVFLLEPASPFDDLYSANLAPDTDWRAWWLEIVGPGFDASDLKRGDVTPHETVHLSVSGRGVSIERRDLASPAALCAARDIRLRKVAGMLGCAPAEVEAELRLRGGTLLFAEPSYLPMPSPMIAAAVQAAVRLQPALVRHELSDQRVMLSLSFLTSNPRLVFWDVVWPDAKYVRGYPER